MAEAGPESKIENRENFLDLKSPRLRSWTVVSSTDVSENSNDYILINSQRIDAETDAETSLLHCLIF